jgi:predicted Zn-dependent protease with MMP-like domain
MERRADCTDWTAPGLGEFEALADGALAMLLPQPYQKAARDLVIRVEDFAPRRLLLEMGVEDPFELTGLYDGIPMTEKSVTDQPGQPDTIWLFRRPMLDEWADRGNVSAGRTRDPCACPRTGASLRLERRRHCADRPLVGMMPRHRLR